MAMAQSTPERILGRRPRERSAQEQDALREWALDQRQQKKGEMPSMMDFSPDRQRLLFEQLRGLWLAPHELLQPADTVDHQMYIVLRGELRVFGNGSHLGTVGVGGSVGLLHKEEYYHTDNHCAGEQGCVLGVLDYAHSLAAQGHTMTAATEVLQMEPTLRTPKDTRVLLALLEDVAFFQQLSIEAEQLGCCQLLELQLLNDGAVICRQGAIGERFFVILRGSVSVRVEGEEGAVEHLGVGGSFGKLSLLGENDEARRFHSTITAGPECICATIHRDQFQSVKKKVQQQLEAALAKPFLGRTRADLKLIGDVLRVAVGQNKEDSQPRKILPQISGHATVVSMAAGETVRLSGESFVYALEGQAVLDDESRLAICSRGTEGKPRCLGIDVLFDSDSGGTKGRCGSPRVYNQLMPIRATGRVCKLLVVDSTDIRHVRRRTALQRLIDQAWVLCGDRPSDRIKQFEWTELWKGVLKTLAPADKFSLDSALAWCVSDWNDVLKYAQRGDPQLSCSDDTLQHEAFSEALTSQIEEFWAISEPCPAVHAELLAELLVPLIRSHGDSSQKQTAQQLVELDTVKSRSKFFLDLRKDARELTLQPQVTMAQRTPLERIEAELKSTFSLAEAFELEKSAPFSEEERQHLPVHMAPLSPQAAGVACVSHVASAALATPSQWSQRLNAWTHGKTMSTENKTDDEEESEDLLNDTAGSVEWIRRSADTSDDDSEKQEPVNPVHPPPAKMTPAVICGGPPPMNENGIRMASPPREMPREGPSPPPAGVVLEGSPAAVRSTRAPAPPRTPPPVKRRSHKEIAKELFAQRHTGAVEKVAIEGSLGEEDFSRKLPVVSMGLARSGNTQSWALKKRNLPQEIHVGNAKGHMRPFQAPPDPKSIDQDTGLPINRHRTTTRPVDSPRNAEKRAAARAERQKVRAAKAAATRTVVPGKLAPEPPRTVLQPKIIGSERQETEMMTAEPEKIVLVNGVDTDPDRTYAVLPAGVPKEWIALHYKSERKREAEKKEAAVQVAAAIARGVTVPSAQQPIKAAAKNKMPFVAAIGFSEIEAALKGGADTITAAQTITAERWLVREESTLGTGRPPQVLPTATPYGHSGRRKPLERLAPPARLSPWCADGTR